MATRITKIGLPNPYKDYSDYPSQFKKGDMYRGFTIPYSCCYDINTFFRVFNLYDANTLLNTVGTVHANMTAIAPYVYRSSKPIVAGDMVGSVFIVESHVLSSGNQYLNTVWYKDAQSVPATLVGNDINYFVKLNVVLSDIVIALQELGNAVADFSTQIPNALSTATCPSGGGPLVTTPTTAAFNAISNNITTVINNSQSIIDNNKAVMEEYQWQI